MEKTEMNKYRGVFSAFSDTFIEWQFESRCNNLKNGNKIFTEWCHKKDEYISIMSTISFNFQHYSRHDESHSVCILHRIEQILGKERIKLLSAGDLWLILQVAYSHDIGMALTHDQLVDLWKYDEDFKAYLDECLDEDLEDLHRAALFMKEADNLINKRKQMQDLEGKEEVVFEEDWQITCESYLNILVAEYIRKYHAFRAKDKGDELDPRKNPAIASRLYNIANDVVAMHACNFEDIFSLKDEEDGFGDGNMHPQFAAAMLRLGDLLDIDNNRFDPYVVDHFGRLPSASMLHMKKHKAITHICVSEAEISVEAETDEYDVAVISDSWFKYIDREVENLICYWNQLVPKALIGCRMKKSICKTFLSGQLFDSSKKLEFSVNKERLINLLIGTSVYQTEMECIREYIQNALDASKVQLWIDLVNGKYDSGRFKNDEVFDNSQLTPFDLDRRVYENYQITISVEWNEKKDKIRLKFHDNGIGIEREYMEKLSTIGTGWHGRPQYANYLHKMVKWLRPTGGFGIGMQSAFMITDSVEIRTKSDKDVCGYKVVLNKEKKTGTVAITELKHSLFRGTTIIYEISPEKFQSWTSWLAKQGSNEVSYLGEKKEYGYESEVLDEFDEDGILLYVEKYLKKYIQAILPNSLFPIAVKSSITQEKIINKTEWPEVPYWKEPLKYIQVEHDEKEFIGVDVSKQGSLRYLIWNKTDGIFMSIKTKGDASKSKICYKNIIVREWKKTKLDVFSPYTFTVDFMGPSVKDCLHLHRNSFLEKFDLINPVKECFWIYLYFLKKNYVGYCERENDRNSVDINVLKDKKGLTIEESWYLEWCSYLLQLICIIEYPEFMENSIKVAYENITVKRFKKGENGEITIVKKYEDANKILEDIRTFYYGIDVAMNEKVIQDNRAIVIGELQNVINTNSREISTTWERVSSFLKGKIGGNGSEKSKLLNTIDENGVLQDENLIRILKSDKGLKACYFKITDSELRGYMLEHRDSSSIVSESELVKEMWDISQMKRFMSEVKEVSRYKEIQVNKLPFRISEDDDEENDGRKAIYIISPLSGRTIHSVEQVIHNGIHLDYEKFRQFVWGERGQELSSYHRLIEFVYKNQIEAKYYSSRDIKACYEELLKDIYKEHILKRCKKQKGK